MIFELNDIVAHRNDPTKRYGCVVGLCLPTISADFMYVKEWLEKYPEYMSEPIVSVKLDVPCKAMSHEEVREWLAELKGVDIDEVPEEVVEREWVKLKPQEYLSLPAAALELFVDE